MVSACSTHHQTGDTDSFQLVIPLMVQLDNQGTCVPCEARIVWYATGGYPFSPGHYVTSITYREGLMALPGQGQLMNLR